MNRGAFPGRRGISRQGKAKVEVKPLDSTHAAAVRRLAPQAGLEADEVAEMIDRAEIHIALVDREMVGFIALEAKGHRLEVAGLVVVPKLQRRGVGKRLLRFAERKARSEGAATLAAITTNDNVPALALYQKAGFRIESVRVGATAEHHGREERGWQGIPVRNEIRLVKPLKP